MYWHPVKTLPDNWGSYLVWDNYYGMDILWYQFKDGGKDGRKAGNWYCEEHDCPMNHLVSYWTELPPPPLEARL